MPVFLVHSIALILGFIGVTILNYLNSTGNYSIELLNSVQGKSIALLLCGSMFYNYQLTIRFEKSNRMLKLIFTGFFFLLSLSNLADEFLFDPYVINWHEYATATILLIFITYVTRIKENRI